MQALVDAIMPPEPKFKELLAKNKCLKAAAAALRVLQHTTEDVAPRVHEGMIITAPRVQTPAQAPPEACHRPTAPASSRARHTSATPPASATHLRPRLPFILHQITGDDPATRTYSQTPPPLTGAPSALPFATAPPQPCVGAAIGT